MSSVLEPEPDFFAGARAVEKAPALGCCLAQRFFSGKVATFLIKFSHIISIYTHFERKNR